MLSIVFGVVVSILGFALGSDAMSKLQYVAVPVDKYDGYNGLTAADINAQMTPAWYFNDLLPAKLLILLAVVGIYLSITERNRERGDAK